MRSRRFPTARLVYIQKLFCKVVIPKTLKPLQSLMSVSHTACELFRAAVQGLQSRDPPEKYYLTWCEWAVVLAVGFT